jgi:sugar phosphate isomerase/epimerase
MRLALVRHLWGTNGSWETLFPRIKASGYEVVESAMPPEPEREWFKALLHQYGFGYIAQIFTAGESVAEHVTSFREQLRTAAGFAPILVNAHSGRDIWTHEQAAEFFGAALQAEAEAGLPVAHETHRGRVFFNARDTVAMLNRFDALKLCCDFSHWVCVSERLLEDQEHAIALAASRCIHLHARVGYEQGPQVPDPSAPEYSRHLEAHERWWRMIWDAQVRRGHAVSTLTPEFGPPLYLHTLPHTDMPVGDLWKICDWQARRQAAQFEQWSKNRQ